MDIPDSLTPSQIEAMTLEESQAALSKVAKARRLGRLDDETSARLKSEFKLLMKSINEKRKRK